MQTEKFDVLIIGACPERTQGFDGLYAIGDGAGITRGLMQASATGIVVARDIAEQTSKDQ